MKVTINGKAIEAGKGQTILEVAGQNGIVIPTLCHHPGLEPAAMCRLCTVEINEGGRPRLVTACNYPLRREARVETETPEVRQGRKLILELLAARCPGSPLLAGLAAEYGADLARFTGQDRQCVMCGLCARVCERVGGNCLTLSGRGVEIRVSTAFGRPGETCIGCGACVAVCPVKAIRIEEEDGERRVLVAGRVASRVELPRCRSCGRPFGPLLDLAGIMSRLGKPAVPAPNQDLCPACARLGLARRQAERHFEQYALLGED